MREVLDSILRRRNGSIIPQPIITASASRCQIFPLRSGTTLLKRSPSGGRRIRAGELRTGLARAWRRAKTRQPGKFLGHWERGRSGRVKATNSLLEEEAMARAT